MKSRLIVPAVAFGLLSLWAANPAQAGLFGRAGGATGCGSPAVVWSGGCDSCATSCCDPCGKRPGLLDRLRAHCAARKSCRAPSCCEATCGVAEPACGYAEPACGYAEPACGYAEPACGYAEPACGCADPCGDSCCQPRRGLLDRLRSKLAAHRASRCCSTSCCSTEPSCGVAAPSCGCNY